MSEYIEIETEIGENGRIYITTNLPLSQTVEAYDSLEAMEEGTPVAQALSVVEGIAYLQIDGSDLTITPDADTAVHMIVNDVTAVLKDFFL